MNQPATARATAEGTQWTARVRITNKRGDVLAAVGQTCERVPIDKLEEFEARGYIVATPATNEAE